MPPRRDTLHGTLDALILKTLTWGPRHGYAISRWLRETSRDAIQVEEGSLYPALYRLEQRGLLKAAWDRSDSGRRTKVYSVTAAGRRHLAEQRESWERFAGALAAILRAARPC